MHWNKTTAAWVQGGVILAQVGVTSLGLGGQWIQEQTQAACAVAMQYPLLVLLFVHMVELVCLWNELDAAHHISILAIVALAAPLPSGLYLALYPCTWPYWILATDMALSLVLVSRGWWPSSSSSSVHPPASSDSPSPSVSVSETEPEV